MCPGHPCPESRQGPDSESSQALEGLLPLTHKRYKLSGSGRGSTQPCAIFTITLRFIIAVMTDLVFTNSTGDWVQQTSRPAPLFHAVAPRGASCF